MRRSGSILLLAGILGFFYASSRLADLPALDERWSVSETLDQPAGRWTMARYGCGVAALLGALLTLVPKAR